MSVQYNNAFSDQFGIPETAGSVIQFGTVGTGIPLEKAISLFKPVIGGVIGGSMTAAQRLTHLKSVLEDNGITNLSGLGNLRIGGNGVNVIPTPGILLPSKDPKGLLGRQVNVAGVTIAEMSGTGGQRNLPTRRTFVIANELKARPLARPVVPHDSVFLSLGVSVAYWVAKEIEISDNTTVVFTSRSKYLYLIAESIKLGSNVQFTWKPPDYRQSIAAIPAPSQPRQTRHPDSDTEVIHGTEQVNVHARNGNDGVHGTDAPAVEIWTLALTGRLVVNFAGQSGQDGQPGQP
ncbi:MAG: hypothetical protein KDH08_01955, partial [Anaerolineae bacterium]|nr:hypothetical protein [Anaerolineae bacterium]